MATTLGDLNEHAQHHCDDPVVAAARFKPNAEGDGELRSFAGLTHRQLLKGRGAYLAERVLVAVTTVEVVAIAMNLLNIGRPRTIQWRRDIVSTRLVPIHGDPRNPGRVAILLEGIAGRPSLELATLEHDPATETVLELLLCGSSTA